MANQIKTKFIGDNQVNSDKILLENNTAVKSKDQSGVEQDLVKLDNSNKVIVYRDAGPEEMAYQSDIVSVDNELQGHINDSEGAHNASAISVSPSGNLASDDVQSALEELQVDINGINTVLDGLSGEYVDVTGDTMTGDLIIQNKGLFINDASLRPILSASAESSSYLMNAYNSTNPDGTRATLMMDASAGTQIAFESRNNWDPAHTSAGELYGSAYENEGLVGFFTQSKSSEFMDMYMVSVETDHTLYIDINGSPQYQFNNSSLNMFQNELLNASKLEVKDSSGDVIFRADSTQIESIDSNGNGNLMLAPGIGGIGAADASNSSNTASVTSLAITGQSQIISAAIQDGGYTAYTQTVAGNVGGSVVTGVTNGTGASELTVGMFAGDLLNAYSIQMSVGTSSAVYRFLVDQLDMDGKKIVDVQQLENLSAATMSGNAVRWNEVGQYDAGAGYGLATLGPDGKILAQQLPSSVMEYKGTWDASTNTPTLANGNPPNAPEDAGHLYKVSVGGTVNFGAGPITFNAGDQVILSADLIWEKSTDANLVTSVNTYQGVVVLKASDIKYLQSNSSDWTVADDSSIKLTLDEVGSRLTANEGSISNHINDMEDAHDASAISISAIVNMTATDVQGALAELQGDLNSLSFEANAISYDNTTSGLAATDVQEAIDELASEKYDSANFNSDFDNRLATKSTTNLAEGTNLYFTDARAKSAAVSDVAYGTSWDSVVDVAPSKNAVYDALVVIQDNIDNLDGYTQDIRDDLDNLDGYAQDIRSDLDQEVLDRIAGDSALDIRVSALEADKPDFHKMKVVISSQLVYIDLDHEAIPNSIIASVDRLNIHKDEDYSVTVVGGKTRLTWIGDFASGGVEGIEAGMTIFVTYAY